jgi:vitamin B12 transporter
MYGRVKHRILFAFEHRLYRCWWMLLPACFFLCSSAVAQVGDSTTVLQKVTVTIPKKTNTFTSIAPVQNLSRRVLQQLNATTVGDAAKYFSGVLVRDYGGVGGLKTVSVRSLGASQTGVLYDGIPVSDAQTGQADLSRFSQIFTQSVALYQAHNMQTLLLPARTYAAAAVLAIATQAFTANNRERKSWQAGMNVGSFGLWQPSAGVILPLGKRFTLNANADALFSTGNYPYYVNNGVLSERKKRDNSRMDAVRGEINLTGQLKDSSLLQVKISYYHSERGLPGALVFYNDRSEQKLWNKDLFVQSRYQKQLAPATALLISGKYSYSYTRYTDPDFLNNQGGLNNKYHLYEWYISGALQHQFSKSFGASIASDAAYAHLNGNLKNFAIPSRISNWNSLSASYRYAGLQLSGTLLHTYIHDETKTGAAAAPKNKITPTFAVSFRPDSTSPFMARFFYKRIFRMPTFNDLYYTLIGNRSLRPELADQYNAGLTYSKFFKGNMQRFSISADAYYNRVKDKIIAVPSQNLFVWTMLNLVTVDIKGVDITSEATGDITKNTGWFYRIAYTWQQALDVTNPVSTTYKNRIPYTPDHSGSGLLSFSCRNWSYGYSFLFSGTRYVLGENNPYNQLAGWMTHDVFVARSIKYKKVNIYIKGELDNISNKYYDVIRYYPMPGRSFKISLLFNN